MIYITGDTHMPLDVHKLNTKKFPQQKEMTKKDIVIIAGDFGGIWDGSNEEKFWLKWLQSRNFTTCFIDGNHENFDRLHTYEVKEWNGGKVHFISDSIIHLMRGQVYTIDGLKFFTMGGATSIDKYLRKEGVSWWPQEMPSNKEFNEAMVNLDKNNWKVEYIITHTPSLKVCNEVLNVYENDPLLSFFNMLEDEINYKHWYFGHLHRDINLNGKQTAIFERVIKIA